MQAHPGRAGKIRIGPGHEAEPFHGRFRKQGTDKLRMKRRFLEHEHARRTGATAQRVHCGKVMPQCTPTEKKKGHQDSFEEGRVRFMAAKSSAATPVKTASTVMPVRAFHTDIMMPRLSGPRT